VPKEGARSFLQQSIPCSVPVVMRLQRAVQPVAEHIVKQAEEERKEAKHKRAELQMRNPPRAHDAQMNFMHTALAHFGNEVPLPRRVIAEARETRRLLQQQQQSATTATQVVQQQQQQQQQQVAPAGGSSGAGGGGVQQGPRGVERSGVQGGEGITDWRAGRPVDSVGGSRDTIPHPAEILPPEKAGPPPANIATGQVWFVCNICCSCLVAH
jgi:hypothetical protein